MTIYRDWARKYWESGYNPIPIIPRNKSPVIKGWQSYSNIRMDIKRLDDLIASHANSMVGLVMGQEVKEGWRIAAIDIDDPDMVELIKAAIGSTPCGKVGKKGITWFVRLPTAINNGPKRFKRTVDGKKSRKPAVELLSIDSQTVVPPSIHPETNQPYGWVGTPLHEINFYDLPIISLGVIDEIAAICEGKAEPLNELNTMTWLGVNGGGDTHDVCVRAVALMVFRGWSDNDIHSRINRAKREACARNGDTYNWPEADHVIQGWIDSARAKEFDKKGEESRAKQAAPPMERILAEWVKEYLGGEESVVCHLNKLRRYSEGHWPECKDLNLESLLTREFKNARRSDIVNAVKNLKAEVGKEFFGVTPGVDISDDAKVSRLCLKNGTLNLRTGILERHSPDDELMHQLPFDWDDSAECPVYDKFIAEMFNNNEDSIRCVEEFMAYTLVPDNSFQKMLVLTGKGGNGKGTLTRLWSSLFDHEAIGTVAISELHNERQVTSLVGKLLNISSEQNRFDVIADNQLKRIVGDDGVTVRKLYAEPINNVKLYVRMVLQVNVMPSTNDGGDALRRRVIMIDCPNQFIAKPDIRLTKKLIAERCGVLKNRLIPALKRLYEREAFSEPASSKELVNEWLKTNDPVLYWLQECCKYPLDHQELMTWSENDWTPTRTLYLHFSECCKAMNFKHIPNEIVWGKLMKNFGLDVQVKWVGALKRSVKMRPLKLKPGEEAAY
jgi:P4 family phage/plasmid primase-like protien